MRPNLFERVEHGGSLLRNKGHEVWLPEEFEPDIGKTNLVTTGAPERAAAARRAFQRRLIPKRSFALLSRRVEARRFDEVLAEAIRNE